MSIYNEVEANNCIDLNTIYSLRGISKNLLVWNDNIIQTSDYEYLQYTIIWNNFLKSITVSMISVHKSGESEISRWTAKL